MSYNASRRLKRRAMKNLFGKRAGVKRQVRGQFNWRKESGQYGTKADPRQESE